MHPECSCKQDIPKESSNDLEVEERRSNSGLNTGALSPCVKGVGLDSYVIEPCASIPRYTCCKVYFALAVRRWPEPSRSRILLRTLRGQPWSLAPYGDKDLSYLYYFSPS